MSAPKSRVKQQKMARKRQRKESARLRRQQRRGDGWSDADFEGPVFRIDPPEPAFRVKISDVLEEFVEPYADETHNVDEYRALLAMGHLAWNAALRGEPQRGRMVDECIAAAMPRSSREERSLARERMYEMIAHKERHFAQIRRPIIAFDLYDTGNGCRLQVISEVV